MFFVLGNLSGNAIAFALYAMSGTDDNEPSKSSVIGIAIAALTVVCLVHVASRRGAILLSNFFAVTKVMILLMIIILGTTRGSGYTFGARADPQPYPTHNFDLKESFVGTSQHLPGFTLSLFGIIYSLSGLMQPFYVSGGIQKEDAQVWILTCSPSGSEKIPHLHNRCYATGLVTIRTRQCCVCEQTGPN
jgi:Amino acid permease